MLGLRWLVFRLSRYPEASGADVARSKRKAVQSQSFIARPRSTRPRAWCQSSLAAPFLLSLAQRCADRGSGPSLISLGSETYVIVVLAAVHMCQSPSPQYYFFNPLAKLNHI